MSASVARPAGNLRPLIWLVAGLGAGLSGLLAAYRTELGVAAAVALIALPMSVLYPKLVVHVLLVATFANTLTLGGVTVGRLVAPLALVAVVTALLTTATHARPSRATLVSIGCYCTIAVSSLVWTRSPSGTVEEVGALALSLLYAFAFAVLVRDERDLRALLWVVAACSVSLAALWISRYLSGVDRRFNEAGDPNFFAALQVVALPLVMVLAARARTHLRRFLLYGGVALIAASVVSTLSRGGLLTLLVAALVISVLPTRALFTSRAQKRIVFVAAALGLGLLLALAWEDVTHRFEVGFNQDHIAGGRADLWMAAMHAYAEHPVGGIGYGAFHDQSFQLLRTTPGVSLEDHLRFVDTGEYVHNAYLGSLAEVGPLGLAAFLAVLVSAGRSLRVAARRGRAAGNDFVTATANALFVGMLAFCVSSVFLSTETSRTLWLLIGLSLAVPGVLNRSARDPLR